MTALADISKAAAAMYGDRLRGSDLTQFNETHPRDEAGRFATASGGGGGIDPRTARRGRRLRRAQRAVGAGQVRAAAAAPVAVPVQEDPRSLQHLVRRLLPQKVMGTQDKRAMPVTQAPTLKSKPALDEEGYLNHEAQTAWRRADSVFYVTTQQANQFLKTGRLVVGAANDLWGTTLTSELTRDTTLGPNQERLGMVAIRLPHPHLVEVDPDKPSGQLDIAQVLTPKTYTKGMLIYSGMLFFDAKGRQTDDKSKMVNAILEIKVDAHAPAEWASIKDRMSKSAAEAIWEEEEHPRDPRSGRFTAQAGGGGGGIDPRMARSQRRRRRAGRALATIAARPAAVAGPSAAQPERALPQRQQPVPMLPEARIQVQRIASSLLPTMPADAEVALLADPVLRTVSQRQAHYEQHVYPAIRRNLAAADALIQRAATGEINGDKYIDRADRVMFSRQFLSGQRTESHYEDFITDKDVAQSIRQLQSSQRLFDLMQKHGAGQWTMTTGEYEKPETKPATSILVRPDSLAAMAGYTGGWSSTRGIAIDFEAGEGAGFGAKAVSIKTHQEMEQAKADQQDATTLAGALATMRVEDEETYKSVVAPLLMQFSSGDITYDQAMSEVARVTKHEGAARHYQREHTRKTEISERTAEVREAGKQRSAEQRAVNQARLSLQEQARDELAADPRVRSSDYGFEMDDLRDWDLANPDFRPGMTIGQVPVKLRPAFQRWERSQTRKQSGLPS